MPNSVDPPSQRRSSLDSIFTIVVPQQPIDPSVLDSIHASSAASPSLTSFALGSPPAAKRNSGSDPAGINRIYTLVKGVVDGVKDAVKGNEQDNGKGDDSRSIKSTYSVSGQSTSSYSVTSPTTKKTPGMRSLVSTPHTVSEEFTPNPPSRKATTSVQGSDIQAYILSQQDGNANDSISPTRGRFHESIETRGRIGQDHATRHNSITSPASDTVQWQDRRHKPSISNGSNHTSRLNMALPADPSSPQEYYTENNRRGLQSDLNIPPSRKVNEADFDDLLDDDDAGSEILTDEEEAVVGKGGYLGKVARMGNVQSDNKSNIQANVGGKPYVLRSSRRSSSSAITSNNSPLLSPKLSTSPNFSRSNSLSVLGKNAKLPKPSNNSEAIYSPKMGSRVEPASPSTAALQSDMSYTERDEDQSPTSSSLPTTENAFFPPEPNILQRRVSDHLTGLALLHQASSSSSFTTNTTHGVNAAKAETQNDSTFGNAAYGRLNAAPMDNQAKVGAALRQLRRGEGLTRDFWMKDENCKECFLCGKSFSAWRRKHHCRTCGQIFCSSCTTLIPGDKFGYPGSMRVCKSPCLDIVNDFQHDDSGSEISLNYESDLQSIMESRNKDDANDRAFDMPKDHRPISTPLMAIPATRTKVIKNGHRQRKPIIEFDTKVANSSRPGSARSSRPLSGTSKPTHRGHSHSHSRSMSRHQHSRSGRWSNLFNPNQSSPASAGDEQRAPFQRRPDEGPYGSAFQKDSIIDPELAPYMSDEDADDGNMSIFATIAPKKYKASLTLSDETIVVANTKNGALNQFENVVIDEKTASNDTLSAAPSALKSPSTPEGSPMSGRKKRNSTLLSLSQRSPRKNLRSSFRSLDQLMIPSSGLSWPSAHSTPKMPARSSSTRGPLAPSIELNTASIQHVKRLLRQMVQGAKIKDVGSWESALMPIIMKCTDDLNPDVRGGDAIDLRHFVKVKRIPGGKPGDTLYVNGVVFSKNLPLKGMPRQITYPKIAIITFPLEYHRQQSQLMSLEPVIAQEAEYVRNMVNRIVALRPTLLLVGRNVSGLALDHLYAAGIATAVQVKAPVIEAVSRCAQADVIFSAEEIALKPHRIGRSANFEVKTFVHPDIPTKSHKKTFMYISGCAKELGCTIVLRGADMRTLKKLKKITEFMVFVMYNLKLETCLMRDQFALIPSTVEEGSMERSDTIRIDDEIWKRPTSKAGTLEKPATNASVTLEDSLIQASQRLVSITNNDTAVILENPDSMVTKQALDIGITQQLPIEENHSVAIVPDVEQVSTPSEIDLPVPNYYGAYIKEHENTILSASPFVKFAQPYLLMRARNYEAHLKYLKKLKDQPFEERKLDEGDPEAEQPFQLISPEMLQGKVFGKTRKMRELLKAVHEAEYEKALYVYQIQKKQWENYLAQNEDLFDPMEHQRIVTLYSMVSTQTSVPCRGPEMIMFEYYNDQYYDEDEYREKQDYYREPDCTLGQYIEDLYRTRNHICESGCDKKMIDHHRSYVHGQGRLSVHVQAFPCPLKNMQNQILMWSYCKLCKNQIATPVMPMSESTWKYSFGKYLELSYWSTRISMRADICPHDLHRDHVRYFGFQDFAVRFEFDAIDLMEIVVPIQKVAWKPELDLKMKNEQYTIMHEKIHRFWDSVVSRLKSINVESVAAEKLEDCKAEIQALLARAQEERDWLINKLQEKYTNSKYYEVLPLNRGMRAMQERVAEWDYEFADFDQKFFPSEKDIRRMAALQLRKIFLDRDTSTSSLPTDNDSSNMTDKDSMTASEEGLAMVDMSNDAHLSPEDTRQVLSSVVEEDTAKTEKNKPAVEDDGKVNEPSAKHENKDGSPQSEGDVEEAHALNTSDERTPTVEKDNMHDSGELNDPGGDGGELAVRVSRAPSTDLEGSYTDSASPPENVEYQALDSSRDTTESDEVKSIATPPPFASAIPVLSKDFIKRNKLSTSGTPKHGSLSGSINKRLDNIGGIAHAIKHNSFNTTQSKRPDELGRTKSDGKTRRLEKPKPEKKAPKAKEPKSDKVKLPERLRQVSLTLSNKKAGSSQIPIPRSHPGERSRVFSLAKHFEELSREFQRERESKEKRQLAARRSRAFPVVSSQPIVEVYKNVEQAVQEASDDEESPPESEGATGSAIDISNERSDTTNPSDSLLPSIADHPTSIDDSQASRNDDLVVPSETLTRPRPDADGDASENDFSLLGDNESSKIAPDVADVLQVAENEIAADLKLGNDIPKHEKSSLMKILSNFWAERSASGWTSLDYPLHPSDHVFANSDVIVREDEPSSLIAFALDSSDYSLKLEKMRQSVSQPSGSHPDGCGPNGHNHFHKNNNDDDNALQRSLLSDRGIHLKYQFQEGSAKMFCKIFYAEQFDALRRNCGVADRYVESLSRCVKWDSKGGKTRSVFLKTLDDRIVLKQLSQVETTAFLKFAPSYFHIMSEALFHELPTAIAKMLGFYQIFIKNPLTGTEIKWDILVMENLFYDRKMTRTFDLKGSMRNRYVQETGEQNEVLLDENMVDYIYENPLFVREHAKKFLRVCLWNDTLFLERNQVMDYSLMIGIDEESKELVIGLIDCVRTYTFDKKLESLIKATGIAGGGRNKPTITSPKEYKRRFREAMERYVFEAPNCWRQPRVTWMNAVGIPFTRRPTEQVIENADEAREYPKVV